MFHEAQTNKNLIGNAMGYLKRSKIEAAFKDDELLEAVCDILLFSKMAKKGRINRNFIYNFDKHQMSFIIDKLADLANGGFREAAKYKKRGRC